MPVILGCFWPHLYRACAKTVISKLSLKMLTLPLDLVIPLSSVVQILWRSVDICQHFWPYFHCTWAETPIFEHLVKILTTIRFNDPSFPKENNNWTIRQNFQVLFSLYRSKIYLFLTCNIFTADTYVML